MEEAQEYEDTLFYLVDDASEDGTSQILESSKFNWKHVHINKFHAGLRNTLINSFMLARTFKYIVKMDNDCLVPKDWLTQIVNYLKYDVADIVSPNVMPSNAAYKYGQEDKTGLGLRPSSTVGGLWAMKSYLIKDIQFEVIPTASGIRGAYQILNQIIVEKEPRIGWIPSIIVEDIGHWSGDHPEHIKSNSHLDYSIEVGRGVAWS